MVILYNLPIRIKLLWFLPVEWTAVKYTDWDYDGCSFGNGDSIDHCGLLTITVRPGEIISGKKGLEYIGIGYLRYSDLTLLFTNENLSTLKLSKLQSTLHSNGLGSNYPLGEILMMIKPNNSIKT